MGSRFLQLIREWATPVYRPEPAGAEPLRSHWFTFVLRLWLIFMIALSVKSLGWPQKHTNYNIYEYGAQRWWSGESMYDLGPQCFDYRYGPVFAVALSPLLVFPTGLGGVVFGLGSILAVYLTLRGLIRHLLPGTWTPAWQAVYLLLILVTTARMFWSLQVNPLIIAAVAGAALAVQRQRWWLAAFLLAVPVHIKIWPIAAALLMVACWPRQLGGRLLVALVGVGGVPFLTRPPQLAWQQYCWWFETVFGRAQMRHAYRDAWTLWECLSTPVSQPAYQALQLLAAGLVLGLCLWQKRRSSNVAYLLTLLLGLWTSWQMIFGPATERNTFGLIGPLTAWALVVALQERWHAVWMATAMVLMTVVSHRSFEQWCEAAFPLVQAAHPIGVLMFTVWLVGYARRWTETLHQACLVA